MQKLLKRLLVGTTLILVVLFLSMQVMLWGLSVETPKISSGVEIPNVESKEGVRTTGDNWMRQNEHGIWEAYIEGTPYQRGLVFGALAEDKIQEQEDHFIAQIRRLVPSEWFLNTLKYGVVWFNRNMPDHISEELKLELYGVSQYFNPNYEFIGSNYDRILNYHAAHDVGHALQDLSIVGCTSFAVWNEWSEDSTLLIARNFDFYMGDDFSKDKLVLFVRPDSGFAFASITWAGFMGVVSGMNEHGLTVTLNAAKSRVPTGAKTPISLLAREILQYAKTIEEAYEIAKSRETFVSESILIGSASDGNAAVIEKAPDGIDLYSPEDNRLVCTNHFQSNLFYNSKVNQTNIQNSDSDYRFRRVTELLDQAETLDSRDAVAILRNQKGVNEADLGMGNPKAINQLLAHHGVVFQPEKRLMWVSANPFQIGEFVCYDLNSVFDAIPNSTTVSVDSLFINADSFLESSSFQSFLLYKELKNRLFENVALGREIEWDEELEEEFINSNPKSYITYSMLGDYYLEQGIKDRAKELYQKSLEMEVASEDERRRIQLNLESCL